MDNDSLNDKEISKVFEDCFRQFFKPLCYYAMGFVKDGEAAKDLVHDAFLSAWTHRHEIDFSLPMYPYFLNLTRNNAINYLEHCEVRARYAASEMKKGEAFEMPALDNHEELIAKIIKRIDCLPGRCSEVMRLCFLEGKRYKEIADLLDISVNTVKTHISAGLKVLRDEFPPSLLLLFFPHPSFSIPSCS